MTHIKIIEPGWATTLQDDGRPGLGVYGLSGAGPIDPHRSGIVNRLLGNDPGATVLETAGGLVLEAVGPILIAATPHAGVIGLAAGERVTVPVDPGANFGYLAVRGGFDVPAVLGSRSTDTLAGLRPAEIQPGTIITIGPDPGTPIRVDMAPLRPHRTHIDLWPGPHLDEVDELSMMIESVWTPSPERTRSGLRLDGHRFVRRRPNEIDPIGLVPGAVQIPPDGRPLVVLRDHPVTGGYPVVAVVDSEQLGDLAQCPPGQHLRFRWSEDVGNAGR